MKIGVIGAGTSWARASQRHLHRLRQHRLLMCDIKQEWAENGLAKIKKGYEKLVAKGKIPRKKADAIVAAITRA